MNCYIATSEPITLIDTGTKWDESRGALRAELAELGLKVEDVQRIVVTHAHADHYGLAAEIVRASGAEVWTHRHNKITRTSHSICASNADWLARLLS